MLQPNQFTVAKGEGMLTRPSMYVKLWIPVTKTFQTLALLCYLYPVTLASTKHAKFSSKPRRGTTLNIASESFYCKANSTQVNVSIFFKKKTPPRIPVNENKSVLKTGQLKRYTMISRYKQKRRMCFS